jgi:putative ABC transport system permease protein
LRGDRPDDFGAVAGACALAFLVALGLVTLVGDNFPRTLLFQPLDTALTFLVAVSGGVVASLFGIWRALRTPPSLALGGG